MNKVILFVSFIYIISGICSISPPKLPVTFYASLKIVVRSANVTHNITGSIANDDAKKLFVINAKVSPDIETKSLFNSHLYEYDGTHCVCINITYKERNLPFFSPLKNFVKFAETDSNVIWKCTDAPPDLVLLISVKKATPNVPEKMITYQATANPEFTQNITFIGFQASQPDSGFFTIPDDCTKVPCQNPPKKPSVFFSKFL